MKVESKRFHLKNSVPRFLLLYSGLALLVLAPLFRRGYILTLDMVFTPKLRMPAHINSSYLFYAALHILNYVLPSDVIEKVLLFVILVLAGAGMHLLTRHLSNTSADSYHAIGAYFAGVFYIINPFTYDRFMTGQYLVLFGYALLPWFVRALLAFLEKPAWRRTPVLTAWAVAISIVSIHTVGMLAILTIVALCLKAWRERANSEWLGKLLKFGLSGLVLFLLASSYWLVPLALGRGSTASAISSFSANDQSAFATVGGSAIGRLGNVLRLQGFWAESRNMYTLPQAHIPTWGLLALMLWALVILGATAMWRNGQRRLVLPFGVSMLVAIILAIGTLNGWLVGHVPLFAGYREPEKFVTLVALGYAVFASRGVATMLKYCHEQGGKFFLILASVVLLLLPVVFASTMFWGCNGQLRVAQYPAGWFAANRRLNADHGDFQTLFLPWHLYMYFDFAGRIIASPAPNFFDKPVIISDNPEFNGAASANSTAAKKYLDRILPEAGRTNIFGEALAKYHIKYVLLANDDDYAKYGYLGRQSDLQLVSKNATIELYRNEAYRGD